jgi:polysaccharide deacetylase family protein (PEP-CTERM system associated)
MKCIFSIDVEDWYHILDLPTTPEIAHWDSLPSRVESNFSKLLAILEEGKAKATCFFIGWIAQKYPHLVREAARQGHEIASHGYEHRLAYEMTSQEFLEDAMRSKKVIEEICGRQVWGYRASGFSLTKETPWFFDKLIEAGYRYDSSLFPATRGHGGLPNGRYAPYRLESADFVEFPVSVEHALGRPICFFGGGYLRLFPYSLVRTMTRRVLRQERPAIFYVHPREIDLDSPRLAMGLKRRFKSYVNIATTEPKIKKVLSDFEMVTFREYLVETVNISAAEADSLVNLPAMLSNDPRAVKIWM